MVVREWRARARDEDLPIYPRHFKEAVIPRLRQLEGFVAATLLARKLGGEIEYVVLTRWRSLECVREFAGTECDKAVVEPVAAMALASYDHHVQHYGVIEEATSPEARGHSSNLAIS